MLAVAAVAGAVAVLGVLLLRANDSAPPPAAPRVSTFTIGGEPSRVVVAGDLVWALDLTERRITALDPASGEVVRRLQIGARTDYATDLAAGAGRLWVSLGSGGRASFLSAIAPASGDVRNTRLDRSVPRAITVGPNAVWLLGDGRLARVDHRPGGGSVRPRPVQVANGAIALASGYGSTWVVRRARASDREGGAAGGSGVLERVDQASGDITGRRAVPGAATAMATGLGAVWIANGCAGGWLRAPVGPGPARCTRSGGGLSDIAVGLGSAWAADRDGSAVLRLDARTGAVVARVPLATRPTGVAVGAGAAWAVSHRGVVYRIAVPDGGGPGL